MTHTEIGNKEYNIVTPIELKSLYGKEAIKFMKMVYGEITEINSPLAYMAFIKMFSYFSFNEKGHVPYENIIKEYNKHFIEKFGKELEVEIEAKRMAGHLVNNSPFVFFDEKVSDYLISNQHQEGLKKMNHTYQFTKEIYLEDSIYEEIEHWDHEYAVKRQVKVNGGRLDLLIESKDELIIIELKKDKVKGRHLYQTLDYMLSYPEDYPKNIEMVVVGYEFTEHALRVAKRLGITCVKYDVFQCVDSRFLFLSFDFEILPIQFSYFKNFITDVCQGDTGMLIEHPFFKEKNSDYARRIIKEQGKALKQQQDYVGFLIEKLQNHIDKNEEE
ncbi:MULTISPECIES: hypothetical protein [Bacillus cereus group]|uniref:hypothetical protein n=1 Tax=Bacillus TaxID=1386 RepID=UPI0001A1D53D|nr:MULTISPECIES: hypothetical protein [Bacillus cereus group]EEM68454.1 hypothetical protein bthur0009_54500 [Bacillus thuringiensis serovar andalousiensis BGSC 4AW1]MEB9630851.1 hypothetical protein [Bacillus anthracis]